MRGLVIRGVGGFYFVETQEGIFRAKARGVFKKERNILMIGDEVELQIAKDEEDSWITEILPRRNYFQRPPIANIDKLVVVFSISNPEPNFMVIDKMLVTAESKGIQPIVCINKADLADEEKIETVRAIYDEVYPTYVTTAITGESVAEIESIIDGSKVALAGPSGVGKSTIVNDLVPGINMETGDISSKTARGKHTTRHVEMVKSGDGYIFDTPGFTSLDIDSSIDSSEVGKYYPEMRGLMGTCKFGDCMHRNEPECAIKNAVASGKISKARYRTYLGIVEELEKKRYKYE